MLSLGSNTYGQLGRETQDTCDATPAPVDVKGATSASVCGLVCGDDHSLLKLSNGSVFVWGRGSLAALGLGAQAPSRCTRPTMLPATSSSLKPASLLAEGTTTDVYHTTTDVYLAAGGDNSALLHLERQGASDPGATSSSLYTWGANKWGELIHRKRPLVKPKLVKGCTEASSRLFAFGLGHSHALALVEWRSAATRDKLPQVGREYAEPLPRWPAASGAERPVVEDESPVMEVKERRQGGTGACGRRKSCSDNCSVPDRDSHAVPAAMLHGGAWEAYSKRDLRARLNAFRLSKERELNISCWTASERWRVHMTAESLGLHHQTLGGAVHSAGSAAGRYIRITKIGEISLFGDLGSEHVIESAACRTAEEAAGGGGDGGGGEGGGGGRSGVPAGRRRKSHCRRDRPREWGGAHKGGEDGNDERKKKWSESGESCSLPSERGVVGVGGGCDDDDASE